MLPLDYGKLVVTDNGSPLAEYALTKNEISIGRDPANDLVISNPQVSRRHARLQRNGETWQLENLSQSNPVYLRGQPVSGWVPLNPGDKFVLGAIAVELQPSLVTGPRPSLTNINSKDLRDSAATRTISGNSFVTPVLRVAYHDTVQEVPLNAGSFTLGRAPENNIVIPISTVSRHHAVLSQSPIGGFVITDQNSTNGLLHKGNRIQERHLVDGDVIRIGDDLGNLATLTYVDAARPTEVNTQVLNLRPDMTTVTIGRADDNLMVLNYPQVSAHHALIRREANGAATLEDLGSTNGTFVHGQRVARGTSVKLNAGTVFQIASYQLVYYPDIITQADTERVRIDALDLSKTVNHNTKTILNHISLSIEPKEFVALVGGSGTGKSTLMDALNGFRPATEGKVYMNGDDYYHNFASYRSSLGYVPQDDIIHRELTVERALYYVAQLRLPKDTTEAEIEQRVSEVLEDVEMTPNRKTEVARLSGGQRKRVSIAVELLAKPTLLFLDEPTSGLDPGLDKRMMFLLRRLADQGRTVVLVTHATSNISVCDKVVFLGYGGRLCFYGSPAEALKFFEVKEFADIYSKLEQSPTSVEEWENKFRQSPYYQQYIVERLKELPTPAASSFAGDSSPAPQVAPPPPTHPAPKAPRVSGWRQFGILARRYSELLVRDRVNLGVLIAQAPIIGFILGFVGGHDVFGVNPPPGSPPPTPTTAREVLFMLAIAAVWLGTSNSAREITKETPIYMREHLVNVRVFPYVMSKVAVLAALCLLQSLLLGGIVMVMVGSPAKGAILPAVPEILLTIFLTTLTGLGMGLLVSAVASNTDKAISIIPIILIPQIILAGVIFPLHDATKGLSYLAVTNWSLNALGTTGDLDHLYFQTVLQEPPTCSQPADPSSTFDPSNYATNPCTPHYNLSSNLLLQWAVLLGMVVLFLGLTCYFQKRKDRAWQRK